MGFRPRRSVLYMPGANARALEKAKTLAADALILDLEDSVSPEQKAEARGMVGDAVAQGGFGHREVVVRINALDTEWGAADLAMAATARPDAILVPKVSTLADLQKAAAGARDVPLWAMIETPLAILNLREIAAGAAATRLFCFVAGTNDLIKESRMKATAGREALLPTLSLTVMAARAFGLSCVDGVYNDIKDEAGFAAECEQGVMLGMDGKTLVHPSQIEPANRIFSPSEADVAWAASVIAVYDDPANAGKGVVTLNGKMVERLHLDMARRIMSVVHATAADAPS